MRLNYTTFDGRIISLIKGVDEHVMGTARQSSENITLFFLILLLNTLRLDMSDRPIDIADLGFYPHGPPQKCHRYLQQSWQQ